MDVTKAQPVLFPFYSQLDMIAAGGTDMKRCIGVMDEAFALLGKGDYVMGGPNRNSHGMRLWFPLEPQHPGMPNGGPDQRFLTLPAYLGGRFHACGNKWYGSNIHNPSKHGLPRSILLMILNEAETARPLAIMEANLLSGMRTGAVIGLSARYLARKDSQRLGVIAAGPISKFCTRAIAAELPSLTRVSVYDIGPEKGAAFAEQMSAELGIEVVPVGSLPEAVKGQDVVSASISGSGGPLIEDNWLKEGSLLTLSSRVRFEDSYLKSARIVADNWKMHQAYRDEGNAFPPEERLIPHQRIHELIAEGQIRESSIHELGHMAAGITPPPDPAAGRTVFLSNGMGIEDVAWACELHERARSMSLGTQLMLWDEQPYVL